MQMQFRNRQSDKQTLSTSRRACWGAKCEAVKITKDYFQVSARLN